MIFDYNVFSYTIKTPLISPHKNNYTKGSHKGNEMIGITTFHKICLKCECNNGKIVNGNRRPFVCSYAEDVGCGVNDLKDQKLNSGKKINFSTNPSMWKMTAET